MENKKKQVELLNSLIERCIDSQKGYEQAADASDKASLKMLFHNTALERKDFANALKSEVARLDGEYKNSGSLAGTLHRNWLDIKALLSASTEEAILEECQRGDKRLVEDYRETIKEGDFSGYTLKTMVGQLENVQSRLKRLDVLEERVS